MSGTAYLLIQNAAAVIEILLWGICLLYFFYPFLGNKSNRIGKLAAIFLIFCGRYVISEFTPVYGWLAMLVCIVLLTAFARALDMESRFTCLLGILFFGIQYLVMMVMESIIFLACRYLITGESAEKIYKRSALVNILCAVVRLVLAVIFLWIVRRQLKKQKMEPAAKELFYMSLFPAAGILFGNIVIRTWVIVKGDMIFGLYEQYPVFLGLVPFASLLFYAGTVLTIASYQEMIKLQEERKKYFVEEQQVHAIQERMDEVEQFYTGIRRMKHEMRNHLTNIRGLMESGNYEDMQQYLSKMDESMNVFEITIQTGNAVTDVIVNDKQKAADRQGIRFQSEFSYPASEGYDAYDIGIIINNLLQNALEACEKMNTGERYIALSGRQKKKFFLIEVRNSFDGEIIFDKSANLPVSTKKKNGSIHGIGLSNVKREVEKYMGDMDIRLKKNEFCVTVLLQESSGGQNYGNYRNRKQL